MEVRSLFLEDDEDWESIEGKLRRLDQLLADASEGEFYEILAVYQKRGFSDRSNYEEFRLLMSHWTRFGSREAVEYALNVVGKGVGAAGALAVFRLDESFSPDELLSYQNVFPEDEYAGYSKLMAERLEATDSGDVIMQFVDRIGSGPLQRESLVFMIGAAMRKHEDPAAVAAWAEGKMEPGRHEFLPIVVAEEWAAIDPEKASLYAMGIEDPDHRAMAISTAIDAWTQRDPQLVGDFLNELGNSPDVELAMRRYAIVGAIVDPESAMTWAEAITDPELRDNSVYTIVNTWARDDQEAAYAYVDNRGERWPEAMRALAQQAIEGEDAAVNNDFPKTIYQ